VKQVFPIRAWREHLGLIQAKVAAALNIALLN